MRVSYSSRTPCWCIWSSRLIDKKLPFWKGWEVVIRAIGRSSSRIGVACVEGMGSKTIVRCKETWAAVVFEKADVIKDDKGAILPWVQCAPPIGDSVMLGMLEDPSLQEDKSWKGSCTTGSKGLGFEIDPIVRELWWWGEGSIYELPPFDIKSGRELITFNRLGLVAVCSGRTATLGRAEYELGLDEAVFEVPRI